tara:strand:+ start:431 stop:940 length:510 start_codon:yes stop_codon:yes gene_type:complete
MITRKSYFHIILVILSSLLFYSSSAISEKPKRLKDLAGWDKRAAIVQTQENEIIEFRVLIARSNKQRRQGLMHIESMEEDQGMLFVFDPSRKVSMWMSNTPMTLDMLFIDKNGKIINIAKNTTPYSTKGISSVGSINWVLEINGGLSDQLNIKNGDHVRLSSIKALDEE